MKNNFVRNGAEVVHAIPMLRDEPIFAVPMKKWNSTKDCSVVAKESRKQKLQKWVGVAWRAFFGYTDSTY